jgi:hypothetical protein
MKCLASTVNTKENLMKQSLPEGSAPATKPAPAQKKSKGIAIELLNPHKAGSGGVFWDQLQGAVDGMEFIPHASLKEVFLNNDVSNITKSLFQGVTDQMFT